MGAFPSSSEHPKRHVAFIHCVTPSLVLRSAVSVAEVGEAVCGGFEKENAFWEAGGRVTGWATCRKQGQEVEMLWAEEGLVVPVPGPGPGSELKHCSLHSWVCGAQPAHLGARAGGGAGELWWSPTNLPVWVYCNLSVPKALHALHIVPSLAGYGNADQKAVPGHMQSAN